MEMAGRIWVVYNIIMESFQNPNITIIEICREPGIAVSMFYKCKEQLLEVKDLDKALMKENEILMQQ